MASKRVLSDCESASDYETDGEEQVLKGKQAKKKCVVRQRIQRFTEKYTKTWPFIAKGQKGDLWAFCTVCKNDFSISHGGGNDIERHITTAKHKKFATEKEKTNKLRKITTVLETASTSTSNEDFDSDVIRAEVMLVEIITELNLPFTALDTFTKACKVMFKDSKIAQKLQCGRSKGTAIIKEIAAKETLRQADRLRLQPFTLSTDGSNDSGSKKLFPLVMRTFDEDLQVRSEVLAIPACEGSADLFFLSQYQKILGV